MLVTDHLVAAIVGEVRTAVAAGRRIAMGPLVKQMAWRHRVHSGELAARVSDALRAMATESYAHAAALEAEAALREARQAARRRMTRTSRGVS